MPDFPQRIKSMYDRMTGKQKHVADYFLENYDMTAFKRLDEVAMHIGVSTTSVIRFARTLGFRGYADMQHTLQQYIIGKTNAKASLPDRLNDSIKHTKQDKLLVDAFQNDIDNIHATLAGLSEETLTQAVSSIIQAKSVYVLGTRGTFSVAHYLGYRLSQIKKGVHLIHGTGMIYPEEINTVTSDDICIAFLMPRYSKLIANIVSWMKKGGVKIILFTQLGNLEIHPYGDIILPCQTTGISYKSSLVSAFCLCNYLLAAVAYEDHDNAMKTIAQTEELLNQGFYLGL